MNLSTLGQQLFLEIQLGAPPFFQKTIVSPLNASKQTLRSVLKPYFKVQRLEGWNEAGPLAITYIGLETAALNTIKKYFFIEYPKVAVTGHIPISQTHKIIDSFDSDLIIVVAGKQVIDKLPQQQAIVSPSRITLLLDTRGTWEDVKARFRRNVIKTKLRLLRKYDYTYRISHNWTDFDHYHDNMYIKLMDSQHDQLSDIWPRWQSAAYFKHGFLFLAKRDDRDIAGLLSYPQQKTITLSTLGVLDADTKLLREGAVIAVHILLIKWANERGFETVDFMDTAHNLNDGIYRFKRQLGTQVVRPNDDSRMWMRIQKNTPAVAQCLKDNPLIIIDGSDKLQGLITVDDITKISDKDKKKWEKWYATPGLENLLVYSIDDLFNDSIPLQNAEPILPQS